MHAVTQILSAIEQGDPTAAQELLPLVYDELRKLAAQKLAREAPGQTLQATALVHEAYLRLVDVDRIQHWDSRRHFFAAAAEAMRRILIDGARRKAQDKHGGTLNRVELSDAEMADSITPDQLLVVDDALAQLEAHSPEVAAVFKLRYYTGCSVEEAGDMIGISRATAYRHWTFARAWLLNEIQPAD